MTQAVLLVIAAAAAILALIATVAERRRKNRRDLDKVGLMPWPLFQVVGVVTAAMCLVYALKLLR